MHEGSMEGFSTAVWKVCGGGGDVVVMVVHCFIEILFDSSTRVADDIPVMRAAACPRPGCVWIVQDPINLWFNITACASQTPLAAVKSPIVLEALRGADDDDPLEEPATSLGAIERSSFLFSFNIARDAAERVLLKRES